MKVQFDLRPAGMLEKERKQKSFNPTRLLAFLLMTVFFVTSLGYIGMMIMKRFEMQEAVIAKQDEVSNFETNKALLLKQVNDYKAKEKVFSDTLKIMQDDLPTIEVLNALETHMDDYGIGFDTLRFIPGTVSGNTRTPNAVEVSGLVASDKQIIDFSERLRSSGVFSDVLLPVTTRNEQTGMISFTLRMPVLPIGQIQVQR